ncbi:hypothetical protein BDN72DRAFT_893608 [Pluteus cervinus]|uniref:Uncharacterized protein n=1 Tax=Pluteus cervinus TaxID=181527 RepID=A0ACD3B7I5_9AGAR|nr:hypothetical protein BDN72DRAFT_893608 [Pluteus cervinus]
MDPSAVDFRAFYPYTPNEVKHRKRTTSAQLKILENVFKRDTKPNAALRNELATQLEMTARGVQVWFQNRRAKEKIKAGKVVANKASTHGHTDSSSSSSASEAQLTSSDQTDNQTTPSEVGAEHGTSPIHSGDNNDPASPQDSTALLTSAWSHSPADSLSLHHHNASLLAARRGSLPVNVYHQSEQPSLGPPIDPLNPLARRSSVDALYRLASNPYAPHARAKNGLAFAPRLSGQNRYMQRPGYPPRAVHPYNLDVRRSSMDSRGVRFSPNGASPSPLSSTHAIRGPLPEHPMYAISSRPLTSPIPGPLPSPGFSFGAASTQSASSPNSADSERNSPDSFNSFNFRGEDTEDDETSASYDALSRFGSFASIATSESSINSTFAHDSPCDDPNSMLARRDSCTSGHFLNMMSNLDVSGLPNHPAIPELSQASAPYIPHTNNLGPATEISVAPNGYPSPTSTISPGTSSQGNDLTSSIPLSRSSELAFALQTQPEISSNQLHNNLSNISSADVTTYYAQQQPNNSQMLHSNTTDFGDKYHHFDPDCEPLTSDGHYLPYSSLGTYTTEPRNDTPLQRQVHYADAYAVNTTPSTTPMGHDNFASFS